MNTVSRSEIESKRLNDLAKSWETPPKSGVFEKFSAADLRLMLECFEPLRDIIHQIASSPASPLPTAYSAKDIDDLAERPNTDAQLQQQLKDTKIELARLQAQSREDASQLKQAADSIEQQSAVINDLKHEKNELEQQVLSAKKQIEELTQAIGSQDKSQPSAELQTLRNDSALAHHLGLDLPTHDQEALLVIVAVLSQKDNLERLWDHLKTRCESDRRAVNSEEMELLSAALRWYNHNWKLRPFQLLQSHEGDRFNFELQQKAKYQTEGEILSHILLPGLADGAGKALRKTLVLTY